MMTDGVMRQGGDWFDPSVSKGEVSKGHAIGNRCFASLPRLPAALPRAVCNGRSAVGPRSILNNRR
jgi:hypothetical protein